MSYEEVIRKGLGFNLLTLFKLEYSKTIRKFDVERYQQALENFLNTIDECKIPPPKEFLTLGIEHFHELDSRHQEMLIELARKSEIIETEALPRMLKIFLEKLKELKGSEDTLKYG